MPGSSSIDRDRPADAIRRNWVDEYAPPSVRPYLRLARLDRPIGAWLLFWPCAASIALASPHAPGWYVFPWFLFLFGIGTVAMRGAGCTYNDIVDRKIDAMVERTRRRPVASGAVPVWAAVIYLILLSLVGLAVLVQFNDFTKVLGLLSLAPIAIYPFMKRVTFWPQAWLGLTFNWGALLGWSAITGGLDVPALLLYAGCTWWTLGYDTIYAHQDKEDDALIGVKSTALLFGDETKKWLFVFYLVAVLFWLMAGLWSGFGIWFILALLVVAAHLVRQILSFDLNFASSALSVFRSNRETGALLTGAFAIGALTL
jgi:4-hydroxybenzoate polyprenyltransferase